MELISDEEYEKMCNCAIELGGKLYHRGVTGPKVVVPYHHKKDRGEEGKGKLGVEVAGVKFQSYGMHGADEIYGAKKVPPILVMAGAIGMKKEEVDEFIMRLNKLYFIKEEE